MALRPADKVCIKLEARGCGNDKQRTRDRFLPKLNPIRIAEANRLDCCVCSNVRRVSWSLFFSLPVGELKQRPRPCYTTFPFVFCFFREAGCPRVVSSFMKDIKPPSILSCWAPLSSKWRIHFFSISLFRCRRLAPRENMAVVMNAADRYGCEGEKRERERGSVYMIQLESSLM